MLINVKLMSEQAYVTLQTNVPEVYKQISNHPSDASWLKDYLGFEPYETKEYTIDDFELEYDENYENVELKNAIILYNHLKELPRYILCNTRFWAWIIFDKAYKQAQKANDFTETMVKNWWIPNTNRRNLMLGIVSRYYFMAELTQDGKGNELTQYLLDNVYLYRNLVYRNISMIKDVSLAIIQAVKDADDSGKIKVYADFVQAVLKWASRLSSVRLIDSMDRDEIYDYLCGKINESADSEMEIDLEI